MPRVSKQEKRNAHEGLEAQSSFKVQLRRLAHHLHTTRRITVEFKRKEGDKYARMVILRPEHKPVAFASGHPSERNLELLVGIAHCSVESGGGGMTWAEIHKACNTPSSADTKPVAMAVPTVVRRAQRRLAAEEDAVHKGPIKVGTVQVPAGPAAKAPKGEGSVARAWAIADAQAPTATRKQIVAAMVAAGINPNTAQAQYVRWNKANRGGAKF